MDFDYTFNIIMVGDDAAGKTSLTTRYISGFFLDDHQLKVGADFYSKITSYKGRRVKLQLWNFGGEEQFKFLMRKYSEGADAAIYLYNITIPSSLDRLLEWIQVIKNLAGDIPILLVGTELHLEEQRAVTKEQGIQAAREHNLSGFIEVSSKTGQKVNQLFETITEILFNMVIT